MAPHDSTTTLITSARACLRAVQDILHYSVVAVDCEGVNLSKSGKLCLVQVATPNKVYLFDILKGGDRMFMERGLLAVLENDRILKVMHDCRRDSEALYFQYGVCLRGVWDSQIAYAVLAQLQGYKTPYPIGLNNLLRSCGCEENAFKDSVKFTMSAMKNFWEVRPMSRIMIAYAAGDVSFLLRAYDAMLHDLSSFFAGYNFERMIRFYSNQYIETYVSSSGPVDPVVQEVCPAPSVPLSSLSFYGIKMWDSDMGFGLRGEVFTEYAVYSTNQEKLTTTPLTLKKGRRGKKDYYALSSSSLEEISKTRASSAV